MRLSCRTSRTALTSIEEVLKLRRAHHGHSREFNVRRVRSMPLRRERLRGRVRHSVELCHSFDVTDEFFTELDKAEVELDDTRHADTL